MIPQLWPRFLTFPEWKLTHPNMEEVEANKLYVAELRLFQNYQDEILNQTLNRQTQLSNNLLNLSADISTILTEGGRYWLDGYYDGFVRSVVNGSPKFSGSFLGNGAFTYRIGDFFKVDAQGNLIDEERDGYYKVLIEVTISQESIAGLAAVSLTSKINSGHFVKVANLDGIAI